METVIRSPQDGVIKKLAHKEGVCFSSLARLGDANSSRIFAKLGQYWFYLRKKALRRELIKRLDVCLHIIPGGQLYRQFRIIISSNVHSYDQKAIGGVFEMFKFSPMITPLNQTLCMRRNGRSVSRKGQLIQR